MRNFLFANFLLIFFSSCQSIAPTTKSIDVVTNSKSLVFGKKTIAFDTLSTLVPEKELTYKDAIDGREVTVVGFPLHLVLDSFMGVLWKEMDGILFSSSDGLKVEITVSKILRYKPMLAYKFAQKQSFEGQAPYSLVWDNIQYPELYKNKKEEEWPIKIIRLDMTRFMSQHARLTSYP